MKIRIRIQAQIHNASMNCYPERDQRDAAAHTEGAVRQGRQGDRAEVVGAVQPTRSAVPVRRARGAAGGGRGVHDHVVRGHGALLRSR